MATEKTAPKFKKLRTVTLAVLKLPKNGVRYIAFVGPMHIGKTTAKAAGTDAEGKAKPMDPATVAHAVDMETGEEGVVICPAVMVNELNSNYPGEGYVGKGFEVSVTRVPEKRYNLVSLSEVEVPEATEAAIIAIRKALAQAEAKAPASKAKA